jgi:hypothetical protein
MKVGLQNQTEHLLALHLLVLPRLTATKPYARGQVVDTFRTLGKS